MMPHTLVFLSWLSLSAAFICAAVIVFHVAAGHRQHMWIMNIVWPVTALYAGPLALWAYFTYGTQTTHHSMQESKKAGRPTPADSRPFPATVALATTHCGSGCTLGDITAEVILSLVPSLLTLFGLHTLWQSPVFSKWVLDFILAFLIGIIFQYFTIVPMRNLSPLSGLLAALKADALSLIAWQAGMYGWMAVSIFALFGHELSAASPVFWFMMQIAMLIGFATSYPVNWWLVRSGIKERM